MHPNVGEKQRDRERAAYHIGYTEEKEGKLCDRARYKNFVLQNAYMKGHLDARKGK